MRLRIYTNLTPEKPIDDPADLSEKIFNYLGPSVIDFTGWGLLRPGLLSKHLITEVCRIWRAERRRELMIYERPQMRGEWLFFDYLFSKPTAVNPIIKCLTAAGLAKYGETKLTNTYLTTIGLNYKHGLMLILYHGKNVETQLDDLAYVISHILGSAKPKVAEINSPLLIGMASHLVESPRWQLRGWVSKEGRTIELDLVQQNREEYLNKLKRGEWQFLLFQNKYSKIKLTMGPRVKTIDVAIKKKYYTPGPKRDLRPIFEELAKAIKPNKFSDVTPSSNDEAGILRAYTERRGIIAAIKIEREKYGREAIDVSYNFQGYDIKSENLLIEVKAFRDTPYKPIQLTENEYQTLINEENYQIYVVEEAWDKIPKINIIENTKEIFFTKQSRDIIETRISTQEYYECEEDKWRDKITKIERVEVP
ncbi:MAG: hypothetical protein QXY75_04360 [Candidatus Bathyarchaeia archaeon]